MAYRDKYSRLCGNLNYKDADGDWSRKLAILDEEQCKIRFFNPYVCSPNNEKIWDNSDAEINVRFITKIEKKDISDNEQYCFEITMVDTKKQFLQADNDENMDIWIKNLHRVAVDPTRRQEGKMRNSIKKSLPREEKAKEANGSSEPKSEPSPEHISYETKIIGGVVVRRPVSKKTESDSESLSGGSHYRTMSGSTGQSLKVIKEGYLTKKGAVVRNWKKRFFRLDMASLSYYEKDSDKEPIRSIATVDILHTRNCASNEGNRENMFEVITGTRTFVIQAETEDEMKEWVRHIQDASKSIQGRSHSGPT